MFKASVQVVLKPKCHYHLKVGVVYVCIYSEQTFEYCFYHRLEIFREWNSQALNKYYLSGMGTKPRYQTDSQPMSLATQCIQVQVPLKGFSHFAHQPINIQTFVQHSSQDRSPLCRTQSMCHKELKSRYRIRWHLQQATHQDPHQRATPQLRTYYHFQVSFERSASNACTWNSFRLFLNFQMVSSIFISVIAMKNTNSNQCQPTHWHSGNIRMCMSTTPQFTQIYHCHGQKQQSGDNGQAQSQKFAQILEKQLSRLNQRKQEEIEILNRKLSSMKMEITKLQARNKLDRMNEMQMKQKGQKLQATISELRSKIDSYQISLVKIQKKEVLPSSMKQPEIVPIHDPYCSTLQTENLQIKTNLKNLDNKISELQGLAQINESALNNKISTLQTKVYDLEQTIRLKDKANNILSDHNKHLEGRIQILQHNHTTDDKNEPVIIYKTITPQPKVNTVYVERPIEKVVYVEVQKIVKQFIQPDRPIVNRIINCGDSNSNKRQCQCDEKDSQYQYQQLNQTNNSAIQNAEEYKRVVQQYRQEQGRLAKMIRERDSEIALMQRKMDLDSRTAMVRNNGSNGCGGSAVEVTVFKDQDDSKQHKEQKQALTTTGNKINKPNANYKGKKR